MSIAVTIILTPVLGPLAPIAGDLAGQITGNVLGVQHGFDWKEVGRTALHTVYGGGLIGDAEAQGISIALGLQKKFDFGELAASGVMSLLSPGGGGLQFHDAGSAAANFGERLAVNTANGLINASIRSLVNGTDFGDTLMAALPSILAQTAAGYAEDVINEHASNNARGAEHDNKAHSGINAHPGGAAASSVSSAQPESGDFAFDDATGEIVVLHSSSATGALSPESGWQEGFTPEGIHLLETGVDKLLVDGPPMGERPKMIKVFNSTTQEWQTVQDADAAPPETGPYTVWNDDNNHLTGGIHNATPAEQLQRFANEHPEFYQAFQRGPSGPLADGYVLSDSTGESASYDNNEVSPDSTNIPGDTYENVQPKQSFTDWVVNGIQQVFMHGPPPNARDDVYNSGPREFRRNFAHDYTTYLTQGTSNLMTGIMVGHQLTRPMIRSGLRNNVELNLTPPRGSPVAAKGPSELARLRGINTTTLTTAEKGVLGEARATLTLNRAGYQSLPARLASNNGFDDVMVKYGANGDPIDIILVESKFSSTGQSSLSSTNMGKQMSREWIEGNLLKMKASSDPAVRRTFRLIDQNRDILRVKINVLDPKGVNRWNILKVGN